MSVKNRGYYKIEGAARAFNFDFKNKIVLDIGSSTGGFTQYALDRGAQKVIAIEKGTNQMAPSLRQDPRVELHEKTDIFNVKTTELSSSGRSSRPSSWGSSLSPRSDCGFPSEDNSVVFDVIVADVSFTSLTKVLAHTKANLASEATKFLVMLKPQFEARPDQLNNGVVKNESIRRDIIKQFEQWLKDHDFVIIKKRDNLLKGKTGNQERFYYLTLAK